MFNNYDIANDPYMLSLQKKHEFMQWQKLYISRKTYCVEQLKYLVLRTRDMSDELGLSVTEWYLHQCVTQFKKMAQASGQQLTDLSVDEKQHLLKLLLQLPLPEVAPFSHTCAERLSHKVETLIDLLVTEVQGNPEFTGLVFVEQRVWVAALAEIISVHPRTKDLFRVGTFVGSSQNSKRKTNIATFVEPRNQQNTLDDFRLGKINLILATAVLEEGIDVSSCHLVICFEQPRNLKSFVQRRGRARKQKSKYFIFVPDMGNVKSPESWQLLEDEMKKAFLDDMRQIKLEKERGLEEEDGERVFEVLSTGARMTLDYALQHLYHFCSLLVSGPYQDSRPQFQMTETEPRKFTARVTLPISLDPALRYATSLESWRTEKMARKDAAFEAYKALYNAGLVNDHLLPSRQEAVDQAAEFQIPDNTPSLVPVSQTLDPWPLVARCQAANPYMYHRILLQIKAFDEEPLYMILLTPTALPTIPEIILHWNKKKHYTVQSSPLHATTLTDEELQTMRSITRTILLSTFSGRMPEERYDFIWLLAPCDSSCQPLDSDQLLRWNLLIRGCRPASEMIAEGLPEICWGLVSKPGDQRAYILQNISMEGTDMSSSCTGEPHLLVVRAPKRRDFLHELDENVNANDAYTKLESLAASDCIVENLPVPYARFARFLPSIFYKFEVHMVAETLRTTILKPISFESQHLPIIVRALTSSATGEKDNYQRLEFFGDCVLKFISTVHLMADNPTWPESFLTGKKGKIVSNGFLARAALTAGLEKFVMTQRFTGSKWAPRYASSLLTETEPSERLLRSSKLIADIIESLIGASYVVGGLGKAFICIQTLLPLENWTPIPDANIVLYNAAPAGIEVTSLTILENLIGYTFNKKMIPLEALTHASYNGPNANCSYERLEFLGDAVLDYIISKRLFTHEPSLSHQKMHAVRTAMANAAFLTFMMFETTVPEEIVNPSTLQPETQHRALWQFLRSGNSELNAKRGVALKEHQAIRTQIIAALNQDRKYPWHLLSLTDPPKFLSDIVESMIGAIYVDSQGSISSCEAFIRRLGIIDFLQRILDDDVDCLHPKERLGHLAVEKDVQYVSVKEEQNEHQLDALPARSSLYKCQVKVGGEIIGGVVEGLKRLNAETVAAWKAVQILEAKGDVMMESSAEEDEFFDAEEGGVDLTEDGL